MIRQENQRPPYQIGLFIIYAPVFCEKQMKRFDACLSIDGRRRHAAQKGACTGPKAAVIPLPGGHAACIQKGQKRLAAFRQRKRLAQCQKQRLPSIRLRLGIFEGIELTALPEKASHIFQRGGFRQFRRILPAIGQMSIGNPRYRRGQHRQAPIQRLCCCFLGFAAHALALL